MNDQPNTSRCALAAGSGRPWTAADVAELTRLYENGGDKADMPIRQIARLLGRSESSVSSKLNRVYPNKRIT